MAMPMAIAAFLACGRAGWRRLLRLGDINPRSGGNAAHLTARCQYWNRERSWSDSKALPSRFHCEPWFQSDDRLSGALLLSASRRKPQNNHRRSVRRAAEVVAVRVGRAHARGRGIIWRARAE